MADKRINSDTKKLDSIESGKIIALAGNPNVGKSTVFNALTGLRQHTGNWPGKTVVNAHGKFTYRGENYVVADLPGTYSLISNSGEEEVAIDFLLFGGADVEVVICDATCLERNLNLVFQTLEITNKVLVCINLIDEAEKKKIHINYDEIERELGVPVVPIAARSGKGIDNLLNRISETVSDNKLKADKKYVEYCEILEIAIAKLEPILQNKINGKLNSRWLSIKIIENNEKILEKIKENFGFEPDEEVIQAAGQALDIIKEAGENVENICDDIVTRINNRAREICEKNVRFENICYKEYDRKIDRIVTSRIYGIPIMLLLLALVLWITIAGANYPSQLLSDFFFWFQNRLTDLFAWLGAPEWLHGVVVLGMYRVLAWVIAVMLPPMAIFFPLFTLLEDFGYLPRVAFNLDHRFKKSGACGKQALTMCMGFGCNAAGVVGCRIIDSKRERLIAILTNNFVPCNGRFPTLITIVSMFFVVSVGFFSGLFSAVILLGVIMLGVFLTFAVSKFLSKTLLKGEASSFTLELPPYRRPQVGKVIVRSIFDRTIHVLARAIIAAAPAGILIWVLANVTAGDVSLLAHAASFLDPFAKFMGLDGVILLGFILGFPANEIVIPIIIMAYTASGSIMDLTNLTELKALLVGNGWTWITAVSVMLFCLIHWPCSTTCLTIKKETGSWKWTFLAFAIPTVIGIFVCIIFANVARLF